MTEIETEVKIEREMERPTQKTTNAFSSRTFSPYQDDLKKFEQYKPTDLNQIYNKFEKESKKQEENDLDNFTKLEEDSFPVAISKTVEVEEKTACLKINLKGKLIIFVASVALILFAFLAIFNAVRISNLKTSIQGLNNEIYYNEQVLNSKISEYNALTDESLLESKSQTLGFDEISSEKQHKIKIKRVKSKSSDETLEGENWFDKICAWVSNLFGA